MKIKLKIDTAEMSEPQQRAVAKTLRGFADALEGVTVQTTAAAAPAAAKTATTKKADATATTTAAAPAATTPAPDETKKTTIEEIRAAVTKIASDDAGKAKVKALLTKHGVASVAKLTEEQYTPFMEDLQNDLPF